MRRRLVCAILAGSLIQTLAPVDTLADAQNANNQEQANVSARLSQAQTFQAGVSGPLGKVSLALARRSATPASAQITIEIRTAPGGQPAPTGSAGSVLAQATLPASSVPSISNGPIRLFDVVFTSAATLSAGATYALAVRSSAPQLDTDDRPTSFRIGVQRRQPSASGKGFFSADNGASWYEQKFSLTFQSSAAASIEPGANSRPSNSSRNATPGAPLGAPAPAATGTDPVTAAAGDIACDPADPNDNNGAGVPGVYCRMGPTSNVLVGANLAAVLSLGDEQYSDGALTKFQHSYDPSWGRVIGSTQPVAGNHEYDNPGASGYFSYFGSAAGNLANGYYCFNVGAWHPIALNGNCGNWGRVVNGCAAGSPQEQWLQADLAAHPTGCLLAYWHEPRFASGASDPNYDAFWQDLYAAQADVVLNGHEHIYERFAPQDPDATSDPSHGIREFVVGTGGKNQWGGIPSAPNSEVFNGTTFGVLEVTLHATSYDWQFVPVDGTFTDTGTNACHARGTTPTITGVNPSSGPVTGGTPVTISGFNFSTAAGSTSVQFGANAGTSINCLSTTQCTATSPPGAGIVDVRVTVAGQISPTTSADQFTYTNSQVVTLLPQPQRLVDTQTSGGPMAAGSSRCFAVAGQAGIPTDASAVVLNVAAVSYTATGTLTVFPNGQPVPSTATLDFDPNEYAIANRALVQPGRSGQVCVNAGNTSSNVILDASGYVSSAASAQLPLLGSPQRLVDTRTAGGPIAASSSRCFTIAGQGGIPTSAAAVVLNVTALGYTNYG